jgi:hypothetical protein
MKLKEQKQPGPPLTRQPEPEIGWRYCARIEPGQYPAYSRSAKVYRDAQFKRHVCAVQFDVLNESLTETVARLTWYLNLGSGEKPQAGRRRAYWAAWIKANGGQPKRRDRLSPEVFLRRYAIVSVGDTTKNHQQITITAEESYSVIRDVLRWDTGAPSR